MLTRHHFAVSDQESRLLLSGQRAHDFVQYALIGHHLSLFATRDARLPQIECWTGDYANQDQSETTSIDHDRVVALITVLRDSVLTYLTSIAAVSSFSGRHVTDDFDWRVNSSWTFVSPRFSSVR